jgi:hypothetical protein
MAVIKSAQLIVNTLVKKMLEAKPQATVVTRRDKPTTIIAPEIVFGVYWNT